ncbi:MAG: type II secretion system protein, partial [Thiobacillaceae bacterium]
MTKRTACPDVEQSSKALAWWPEAGLTLVEMALVLAIIGLMAALFLPMMSSMREAQQIKETRAKLAAIDAALVRFVMLNDRLPCPADGALPETDPNAGLELTLDGQPDGCDPIVRTRAVVPWRTLG